jgi:hypothetical protein
MKKLNLFGLLLVSAFSFAQYPTINSTSTSGLGIGVPTGANFSDAAVHIKAADNAQYSNGGGQQILFAETNAPSAVGDNFRIMNASGTNTLFSPMLSGFGNSHNRSSLQFLALANSIQDYGTNPLMVFRTGLDFTPNTSMELPNAGSNVSVRPLFQWMNWNTPLMTIDSGGKLGLGTSAPTAALHLLTGSNAGMLPPVIKLDRNDNTNQAGLLSVGISSNGFSTLLGGGSAYFKLEDPYGNSANSDMGFSTNANAAQLVIKHNGFVGVGTSVPSANFHSIGTARLESLPVSSTNTDIITTDANGNLSTQSAASLFTSTGWNLNGNAATATDFIGTTNINPLNFVVNNIKSMSLDNGGNVSISTGGISTYQKLYVETNKQNDGIQVNQTGTSSATLDLNASGGAGKRWALHSTGSGNAQGAGHLLFWDWTNNVERMRIDASGAVRIGNVTMPSGYKLYVEEGILTEKVKVAVASSPAWADYVFANDYKLKPLSEVEAYVKENKHLPNIPSASELVKDGLNLGEMQALQMKKIEELTLYLIEMKKEIDTMKKENKTLKILVSQSKN